MIFLSFSRKMSQRQIWRLYQSEFLAANKQTAAPTKQHDTAKVIMGSSAEALTGFCDSLPPLHFPCLQFESQWVMILYPIW